MKPVDIKLFTTITQGEQVETDQYVEAGQIETYGNDRILKYDEGMMVPVSLDFNSEHATLTRGTEDGDYSVLTFEKLQKVPATYVVDGHHLKMEVLTNEYEVSENGSETKIRVDYDLLTADQPVGHYLFELIFTE